jgi:hypothetical protein
MFSPCSLHVLFVCPLHLLSMFVAIAVFHCFFDATAGTGSAGKPEVEEDQDKVFLTSLFEKYVTPMIQAKESKEVNELVPISAFNGVQSLCSLFNAFSQDPLTGIAPEHRFASMEAGPVHQAYVEKWFCFCIVWSLLAAADRPSRKRLDYLMRDIDSTFPPSNTIFDYWVDAKSGEFKPWSDRVSTNYLVRRCPRSVVNCCACSDCYFHNIAQSFFCSGVDSCENKSECGCDFMEVNVDTDAIL